MIFNGFCRILGLTTFYLIGSAGAVADDAIAIQHDEVSQVSAGDQVRISAIVSDPDNHVDSVRTYFKTRHDDRFYFVTMRKSEGDTYTGLLPAPFRGAGSLEYVILAKSASDQIVRTPRYTASVVDAGAIARLD